ncbi:MAG: response regulator [bacterium]|jgi:CheY-like chemotaxis protein|nr:response regulator [bacterium]
MAGETILVVEDNPLNMELVSDILEANGYNVRQAINGKEAVQEVGELMPDLILMDIQLPGLDGLTVTGIIKDNPDTARIPIIALTAHAMRGDEEKAREAGCDGYISKPIDTRLLPQTIRQYLNAAAASSAEESSI